MHEYEVYLIHGFCESEWEYLGNVQAASDVLARLQALLCWPDLPPEVLAVFLVDVLVSV